MRVLKAAVLAVAGAILVAALAGLAVWMFPNLLVNPRSLKTVQKFLPEWQIDWDDVKTDARSTSFWKKTLEVDAAGACLSKPGVFAACFDRFHLLAEVDLSSWRQPKFSIISLTAADRKIRIFPGEAGADKSEETNPLTQAQNVVATVRGALRNVRLRRLDIKLDDIQGAGKVLNGLTVRLTSRDAPGAPLAIDIFSKGIEGLQLQGRIGKRDYLAVGDWTVNASYNERKSGTHLQARLASSITDGRLGDVQMKLQGKKRLRIKGRSLEVSVDSASPLKLSENGVRWTVGKVTLRDPASRAAVVLRRCETAVSFADPQERFNVICPNNFIDLSSVDLGKRLVERLPDRLNFTFRLDRRVENSLAYELAFTPYRGRIAEFDLTSKGMVPMSAKGTIKIGELTIRLKIKEFNVLVSQLKRSFDFIVPVPFNELRGDVEVAVEAKDWRPRDGDRIPVKAAVDLARENTSLRSHYDGYVQYRPRRGTFEIGGDVVIDEMKFVVPSFDPLYGFPSLTADSRIHRSLTAEDFERQVAEVEKRQVSYRIRVKTGSRRAIKLYYYLADPYVPVNLDLIVSDGRIDGRVVLAGFQLTYLKKAVSVESVILKVDKELSESTLNAVLTAERGAYSLRLELLGPVDQPQIYLSSQPELSTQEVLALMLYNKMPSHLTEQQNQDTSELHAALADHAVGLIGAWALSSVPISSISYNPSTKTYSAQVNLPGHLTLSIGSDWENVTGVELAKRIGMNWFLVSSYEPNDEKASEGRMMLEWRRAY